MNQMPKMARKGRGLLSAPAVKAVAAGLALWSAGMTLGAVAGLAGAGPAAAQSGAPVDDTAASLGKGTLTATAYQPIAPGTAFDTIVQDPSDSGKAALEGAALDGVNRELVKAGYRIDQNAPLVMLVGTDLVRGTSKEATIEEFRGDGDTGFTYEHNIFSSTKRSLLKKPDPDTTPNTFRISLSVYDRQSGLYVWRGSIDRGTSDLTPDKAAERMIPSLVAAIGKSVNQQIAIGHE
jgi:hypothetical protein